MLRVKTYLFFFGFRENKGHVWNWRLISLGIYFPKQCLPPNSITVYAVSYTHLDVYKRQPKNGMVSKH